MTRSDAYTMHVWKQRDIIKRAKRNNHVCSSLPPNFGSNDTRKSSEHQRILKRFRKGVLFEKEQKNNAIHMTIFKNAMVQNCQRSSKIKLPRLWHSNESYIKSISQTLFVEGKKND